MEETLIHEATHTSLDMSHSKNRDWLKAQNKDPEFISTYAKEHPIREDLAETFLLYFALKYKEDRIPDDMKSIIENTIPNRLKYLDKTKFELFPVSTSE